MPRSFRLFALGAIGVGLLFPIAVLSGFIGYGLSRLQVWARWTLIVLQLVGFLLTFLEIILVAFQGGAEVAGRATGQALVTNLIPAYIFYLVASAKGAMVFSRPYKEVIRKTPHIKSKTSIIVKVLLVILLLLLGLAVVGGILASLRR